MENLAGLILMDAIDGAFFATLAATAAAAAAAAEFEGIATMLSSRKEEKRRDLI